LGGLRLGLRQAPRFARNNRASDFASAFAEAAADKWATPDKSQGKQDDKVIYDLRLTIVGFWTTEGTDSAIGGQVTRILGCGGAD
jgi:hypothetical protein